MTNDIRVDTSALTDDAQIWEDLSGSLSDTATVIEATALSEASFGRKAEAARVAYQNLVESVAQYVSDASSSASDAAIGLRDIARILEDEEDQNHSQIAALWLETY